MDDLIRGTVARMDGNFASGRVDGMARGAFGPSSEDGGRDNQPGARESIDNPSRSVTDVVLDGQPGDDRGKDEVSQSSDYNEPVETHPTREQRPAIGPVLATRANAPLTRVSPNVSPAVPPFMRPEFY